MVDLEAAADLIVSNARRGVYYPAELRQRLTLDQAFRIQILTLERYLALGETQAGWKVGLTAPAMQRQWQVDEPVFGFLLASGRRPSGTRFQYDQLIEPGFENELCLSIGTTLRGPDVTLEQARAAVVAAAPALEIVEKRGEFTGDLPLAMADNAQQKAFVVGTASEPPTGGWRLAETALEVLVNGTSVDRASGAEVLGDPVVSIAWLANKLAEYGRSLEAGLQVMSGSFTRQYPINAGDRVEARFEPLGSVLAEFC